MNVPYTRRARPQALTVVAVLAAHLALLWLSSGASNPARNDRLEAAPARVTLRLLSATPPPALPPVAAPAPRPPPPVSATRAGRSPSRSSDPSNATAAITEPPQEAALRAEPPASVPDATGPLLDTEASRRAIRASASARAPSLGAQLARAREEPDSAGPQQRLADGVKSAGKGDCAKGEFAGNGMGLLSLPFLAVAVASGNCAK